IDCSDSTGYDPGDIVTDVSAGTVTFDLAAGQSVDCTYTNVPQTGSLLIVKERKHAADGTGDHPQEGVDFTVTGGNIPADTPLTGTTDANGELCLDGLVISSLVGDYTVTETVPEGYVSTDSEQDVSIVVGPACADEEDPVTVNFFNTPLTDVTVSVNSQVDGGTFSSISCDVDGSDEVSLADELDDPSVTITDLQPRTVICTIVIDP
ncbi:prealbumin-like fold domain-containing protein, partial [Agromyces aurantiacus]